MDPFESHFDPYVLVSIFANFMRILENEKCVETLVYTRALRFCKNIDFKVPTGFK